MSPPPLTSTTKLPPPPPTLFPLVVLFLLSILGYFTLHHPHHPPPPPPLPPTTTTTTNFHTLFLSTASNATISTYLRSLTLHPHLAGTTLSHSTATFVQNHFTTHLNNSHTTPYTTLLSYPSRASLSIIFSNTTERVFTLAEMGVSNDVVMPYHAFSPSGSVRAFVVFANYGRKRDYRKLNALGVHVTGCVVVVRRGGDGGGGGGGISRAGVVAVAESEGAAAVLMYDERGGGGGGGVERGTVMRGVGDPLSPGWAAAYGGERLAEEDKEVAGRFPRIPSLPLSYENADVILGSLGGPLVPKEWRVGSGLDRVRRVGSGLDRVRRSGPGPAIVNFTYQVCCVA